MFLTDKRGTLAVILALAAPALLIGIGGAIETSRAVTFKQRLWSAVELSCLQSAQYVNAQKPQDVKANSTSITYPTMIADITNRNFVAKNISTTPTPITTPLSDTNVHVEATRTQPLVFSTLLNTTGLTFTARKDCATISTTAAKTTTGSPQVLVTESFEGNQTVASSSGGWEVDGGYANNNTWNGWGTAGAGIEIDSQRAIAVSSVLFGSYFAELDSDCNTSTNYGNRVCGSNSTMYRIMNLAPGKYEIRYWYLSRLQDSSIGSQVVCGKASDVSWYTTNGQTNRIELYVEKSGNYTYSASNMVDVCVQSNYWTERIYNFTVTTTSDYRISWRAAGRQDTYGGLIDNLRICLNYCPAS